MNKGRLFLIPTPLGDTGLDLCIPRINLELINKLTIFIVEEFRTARRFLKKAGIAAPIDSLVLLLLNEHTSDEEIRDYLNPALTGTDIGLLSEAGLPCVADPGNKAVRMAHEKGMKVLPLVGPSSLMLALMASGLNGQQFVFHGYLPVKPSERLQALRNIDRDIHKSGKSHLFIETPYRNRSLFESIVKTCTQDTMLCIATDLTLPGEAIRTLPVEKWKSDLPSFDKHPTVFILGS